MDNDSKNRRGDILRAYMNFAVPNHEIDSETLGITLIESGRLFRTVGHYLNSCSQVRLNVKPPIPGSFEIPIELLAITTEGFLIAPPVLPYLKEVFDVTVEYFKIFHVLQGKEPKEINQKKDTVEVAGDNNSTITVSKSTVNIYINDANARETTRRQFHALDENKAIDEFNILSESRELLVKIPKKDFEILSTHYEPLQPMTDTITNETNTQLVLKKPVLQDKPASWQFVDPDGRNMNAKMCDETFLESIVKGEQFGMGDRLDVRLRTQKEFDPLLNTHVNPKHEIIKVIKHVQRPKQTEILFSDTVEPEALD